MDETNDEMDIVQAVQYGDVDRARHLIENEGADAASSDDQGYTLLHWAGQEGHVDVLRLLVEKGANPNIADTHGITPLFNAAGEGDIAVVRALIHLGADVNWLTELGAALHNAASYGHAEIITLLLAEGADVNAKDDEGITALDLAEEKGLSDIVALLSPLAA